MNRILIISPSGKLYGSESVLFDYLTNSRLHPHVMVPANSDLEKKLIEAGGNYTVKTYNSANIPLVYTKLFFLFVLGRYKSVYINEAGHVKYILFLAKCFSRILFTVHVRMVEDTTENRWKMIRNRFPKNLNIISISDYISKLLPFTNRMIPDPFIFNKKHNKIHYNQGQPFNVGIIGRITLTKGSGLLALILDEISNPDSVFKFHLFGEICDDMPAPMVSKLKNNKNVFFHGYVKGTDNIYSNLHAVMHLSRVEPLGRIFFESVNYELPFIGINAAGIGEIANQYGYNELIVSNGTDERIAKDLLHALTRLINNYDAYRDCIVKLKSKMSSNMSVKDYCNQVDNILTNF
jgi:hypothetical protein